MTEFEAYWVKVSETIETIIPEELLTGRNLNIIAGAVVVERIAAKLENKSFDLEDAIWRAIEGRSLIKDDH